eukprot:2069692-Lingulodinium_polyedra.AAC.1
MYWNAPARVSRRGLASTRTCNRVTTAWAQSEVAIPPKRPRLGRWTEIHEQEKQKRFKCRADRNIVVFRGE